MVVLQQPISQLQQQQQQHLQPTASLTHSDGPVTSDAALAQLAAEAGLLEEAAGGIQHHHDQGATMHLAEAAMMEQHQQQVAY